jgi:5-methylthioadenosine/S-adenosylhomocysteine deaminase
VINDGSIAIKDGKIVGIGSRTKIDSLYSSAKQVAAQNKIIMPGLINTHAHSAMTLLRGYADDMVLDDWLQNKIWPAEAKIMNCESVKAGTMLAIAEMISAGITCFNDMYYFQDAVAQTAKEANIRVMIGEGIIDYPSPEYQTPDEALTITENLINKYKNDTLVSVAIAPHSPYTCSRETLLKVKKLYDKYKVPIHIHLSETKKEINDITTQYNMRPPAFINDVGLLTEKTIAAHCINLDSTEIELLSKKKVSVAHCPTSNLKLAEGVAPVTPMLRLNMKVSFGTDGASSNNNLSILNEMRIGSLMQKVIYENPTLIDARTAVRMATIEAAKVLNLNVITGSLEIDKYADIIIIDMSEPHMSPYYDPYSTILYSAEESDVETVIINGKIVMENRQLLTVDKEKAMRDVNEWAKILLTSVSIDKQVNSIGKTFQLYQNYPNPFNPITTISYLIPKPSFVTIKIFDSLGREVKTLVSEEKLAGTYKVNFDCYNYTSGIYYCRMQVDQYMETKKIVLLK